MGRHRPDPRGHARILIAVLAVVLVLVLVVIGGIALFGALTSDAAPRQAQASMATKHAAITPRSQLSGSRAKTDLATYSLTLRVMAPTKVHIAVPGTQPQVLLNTVLATGRVLKYRRAPLDVTVGNGAAVDVYIYGRQQPKGRPGQRARWHVPAP